MPVTNRYAEVIIKIKIFNYIKSFNIVKNYDFSLYNALTMPVTNRYAELHDQ